MKIRFCLLTIPDVWIVIVTKFKPIYNSIYFSILMIHSCAIYAKQMQRTVPILWKWEFYQIVKVNSLCSIQMSVGSYHSFSWLLKSFAEMLQYWTYLLSIKNVFEPWVILTVFTLLYIHLSWSNRFDFPILNK